MDTFGRMIDDIRVACKIKIFCILFEKNMTGYRRQNSNSLINMIMWVKTTRLSCLIFFFADVLCYVKYLFYEHKFHLYFFKFISFTVKLIFKLFNILFNEWNHQKKIKLVIHSVLATRITNR